MMHLENILLHLVTGQRCRNFSAGRRNRELRAHGSSSESCSLGDSGVKLMC
jgi:hypothetical protein